METAGERAEVEARLAQYLMNEKGVSVTEAEHEAHSLIDFASRRVGRAVTYASGHWGLLALRGLVALVAAYLFITSPGPALGAMALLLSAWVLVEGVFSLVSAIGEKSWYLALSGVAGIAVGWLMLTRPAGAIVVLFILTAVWALARGASEVAFAIARPKGAHGRGTALLLGIVSCLFGVLLIVAPFAGALTLAFWIGAYASVFGILELTLAFHAFRARSGVHRGGRGASPGLMQEQTA